MEHLLIQRRNPFEIFVLAFLILSCTVDLLSGAKPGSVDALLPGWWWYGWLIGTLVGSCAAVYGILTKRVVDGLYIEWSAIPFISVALIAIAGAQIIYAGSKAALGSGIVMGIVGAFWARRRELHKVIKSLPKKE